MKRVLLMFTDNLLIFHHFSLCLVQTSLPPVQFNGPVWMQINLYHSQNNLKQNFSKQLAFGKSLLPNQFLTM